MCCYSVDMLGFVENVASLSTSISVDLTTKSRSSRLCMTELQTFVQKGVNTVIRDLAAVMKSGQLCSPSSQVIFQVKPGQLTGRLSDVRKD